MPPDDFADALFAQMETKEPLLTCEDMDEIEAMWERQRRNRRAALVLLTKPWAWLNQQVTEDRGFAVAVAQIKMLADEVGLYKGLAEFMEAASVWSMIALASREDMLESAPLTYAARSRRTASVSFSASVRASTGVLSP